jgi:hypothetical protein
MTQLLGLESEACSGDWSVVKGLDGFALDRKIRAAGWNFLFMAAEVKVMFFGALGTKKIQNTAAERNTRDLRQERLQAIKQELMHFNKPFQRGL